MKHIVIVAAIFTVLALAAGAMVYVNLQAPEVVAPTGTKDIAESSLLTVINNNVQVRETANGGLKDLLQPSLVVQEGTYIKTSLTGRAIVEFSNASTAVIDKNAEFTIKKSAENKTKIILVLGNMWSSVQKIFGQGEYYQVETENAVAVVRGTSFGVSYVDGVTTVMVAEGQVSLISIDPITKQQIGSEIIIKTGQKGMVATGFEPVLQELSAADKRSEWYSFNVAAGTMQQAAPAADAKR